MKVLLRAVLLMSFSFSAIAAVEMGSTYTDLKNDCIVVSSATEEAPIDFYSAECKAFGGFTLRETGSDLRYGPALSYNGTEIDLQRPWSFHQMGSQKIEWLYEVSRNLEGVGSIKFKALIYRLLVANEDPAQKDKSLLYVVRLDGEKSCVLGTVRTNEEARKLALKANAECVTLEY